MTQTYSLSGMTCGSCVAKVKDALLKLGDVAAADVRRDPQQVTLDLQRPIPTSRLQAAVAAAGPYALREASGTSPDNVSAVPAIDTASYYPLALLFAYIAGTALLVQGGRGGFDGWRWMEHFMAGFFLVFSFFKLLRLRAFAEGYRMYDAVAGSWPAWGFIYPFVELLLGVAFLTGFQPLLTNGVTLLVMGVSTIGVVRRLRAKQPVQCACLGTVIQLPLSTVTLAEDLLMVAMSAAMLLRPLWA